MNETETDASRIMFINSADTTLQGTQGLTTDYTFTPDEGIVVPAHHAILLSLHHTQIPYSFYNFQNNRNNKLDFSLTAAGVSGSTAVPVVAQYTITLPEANYNAATLLAKIKELLEAHANWGGGTINIRFNRDTLKYEWNYRSFGFIDSRLTLRIATGNNADTNCRNEIGFNDNKFIAADATQDVWFEDNGINQLAGKSDAIGTNNTLFTGVNQNSYWDGDDGAVNRFSVIDVLSSIRSLYIRTNLTTSSVLDSSVGGGFSNILARVPIEVGSGGIITISPSDGSIHKLLLKIREISVISVRLTDQKNRVIDLNGLDWDLSLQFDFIEKLELKIPKDKRLEIEEKKYKDWKTKTEKQDKKK
jgi:hypothetical protein